jgi:hypothetical protein
LARLVKCPRCEQKLNKEEAYLYKKRYYHPKCFEEWQRESQDRKELISYICQLYRLDAPTGMMLKQIKEYKEELKYRYKGMELALRYFHETLGNPVQEGTGIGIIPYVYEDAKNHFITKMKVEESLKNIKQEKAQVVKVISPKSTYKRKIKPIDISSL